MKIRWPIGKKEPLQCAQLFVANVQAQAPGVCVAEDAVIAVDDSQHALKQCRSGHTESDQRLVIGPSSVAMCPKVGFALRLPIHPRLKSGKRAVQGLHATLVGKRVIGEKRWCRGDQRLGGTDATRFCGGAVQASAAA